MSEQYRIKQNISVLLTKPYFNVKSTIQVSKYKQNILKDIKMKTKSTMYNLMRKSELMDDDGMNIEEAERRDERSSAQKFKEKYKDFYTDIKTDISEDW